MKIFAFLQIILPSLGNSALAIAMLFTSETSSAQDIKQLVRLAVIEVDTAQLDGYNDFLKEEIEASIRLEPGVITLYGVAEKEHPERVTLFETYGDSTLYKSHLVTPHFQKYKKGTLEMVKHLELIQVEPILYIRKPELASVPNQDYFIRLIKMQIDSRSIERFTELAKTVMLPNIKKESGVLVMYAVAEKNRPTHISILEVYADSSAYEKHLTTPHFQKYKKESEHMVKSMRLIDVKPIFLGSKPQRNPK
jgi:quinol monooxygenase YgiN